MGGETPTSRDQVGTYDQRREIFEGCTAACPKENWAKLWGKLKLKRFSQSGWRVVSLHNHVRVYDNFKIEHVSLKQKVGIRYGKKILCLFKFIKSLRKRTQLVLCLGCAKYGAYHYESFHLLRTPSGKKCSTSFLNIYLCNFGTGYGFEHINFKFYFHFKVYWICFLGAYFSIEQLLEFLIT